MNKIKKLFLVSSVVILSIILMMTHDDPDHEERVTEFGQISIRELVTPEDQWLDEGVDDFACLPTDERYEKK